MAEQSLNQSIKPFFGNSNSSGMFLEANYPSSNYDVSVNTDTEPCLEGTTTGCLMFAKNYHQKTRLNGMKDNDIHNEYTDFIIRTALYHRELDNPTGSNSNIIELNDAVAEIVNKMLVEQDGNLQHHIIGTAVQGTLMDKINELICTQLQNGIDTLERIADQVADTVVNNCAPLAQPHTTRTGYLCAISHITSSNNRSIRDILTGHRFDENEVNIQIKNAVKMYVKQLNQRFNLYHNPTTDIFTRNQSVMRNFGMAQLTRQIEDVLNDYFKRLINGSQATRTPATGGYRTVANNDYAQKVFDAVFRNWANLHPQAMRFYSCHLHLFRKNGATTDTTADMTGWDDITGLVNDNPNIVNSLNTNEIRINLQKVNKGSSDVNFGNTLPYIPNNVEKLWYSSSRNVPDFIPVHNNINIIRDIYKQVYMNGVCNVNGIAMTIPNYASVRDNVNDFNVDNKCIVINLIKERNAKPEQVAARSQNFSNMFLQDLTIPAVNYRRENGTLMYNKNGQDGKYEPGDFVYDNNCYGTNLKGDPNDCKYFVRDVILLGDSNKLEECLAYFRGRNMFEVGYSEVSTMDPSIALNILKIFEVGQVVTSNSSYGNMSTVQTFDNWKANVLPKFKATIKQQILENYALCDYLKGVIAFVNSNPAILNKNWNDKKVNSNYTDNQYLKALRKEKKYVNPIVSNVPATYFNNRNVPFNPSQMAYPFRNVTYGRNGQSFMQPFGMMMGGASSGADRLSEKINGLNSGNTIGKTMAIMNFNLHENLKKMGIRLSLEDSIRLENSEKELSAVEKRLSELYGMLRTLTDLQNLFKASGCEQFQNVTVDINNLITNEDTLNYLAKNIADVKSCLANNVNHQNEKCTDLARSYASLLENN